MSITLRHFGVILHDPLRKSWLSIAKDLVVYTIKNKELPMFYFGKFLYRKNVSNIDDYLTVKQSARIMRSSKLHRYEYTSILRNKLAFALHLNNTDLPLPKLYAYNVQQQMMGDFGSKYIKSPQDLIIYFNALLKEVPEHAVFVKPAAEMGGAYCFILRLETLEKQITEKFTFLINNICLYQGLIRQHEVINKIHSNSVNTIRFDTYIDKAGKYHILSAAMRFGAGPAPVDNASSGGFFVLINLETGCLYPNGKRLMKFGGGQITEHPNSGVTFGGVEIPYFKEACELTLKALSYIPDRMIGWDIAITPDGPVIVEGNDNNSMFASDIVTEGYLKNSTMREVLEQA